MIKTYSPEEAAQTILLRQEWDAAPVSPAQAARTRELFGEDLGPEEAVRRILRDVKQRGDEAVHHWTRKLDGVDLSARGSRVTPEAMEAAAARVDPALLASMRLSAERVLAFHKKQPAGSWFATEDLGILGQKICPIGRVACYVPGGSAPLASTLIMTVMVAKAAGVPQIVVVSPPRRDTGTVADVILAAAHVCGVTELHALGGAQAIGALAYGTATLPRVDKIVGPGNSFVVIAKRQVFGTVGIDALPGPTETIVVADASAEAAYVAADLMAQSEHSGGSAILATPDAGLIDRVRVEMESQVAALEAAGQKQSAEAVRESFATRSGAVLCRDLAQAVDLADQWAPEHLCLSVADPWAWLGKINRAGGVFMGEHSYEVLGDYVAGPSHTMPTGGTARFTSPCNVWDFVRVMNVIALDHSGHQALGPHAARLADSEGLAAHAGSARVRD